MKFIHHVCKVAEGVVPRKQCYRQYPYACRSTMIMPTLMYVHLCWKACMRMQGCIDAVSVKSAEAVGVYAFVNVHTSMLRTLQSSNTLYAFVLVCIYLCMYVCMYMCIYGYMHVNTCMYACL
jgi:hypothetical protein